MLLNNPTEVSLSKENNLYLSCQESLGIHSKSPLGCFTCFSNKACIIKWKNQDSRHQIVA